MSAAGEPCPAPRANAENRAVLTNQLKTSNNTANQPGLGFAADHIARQFGLSSHLALLLARLADQGAGLA